MSAWEEVRGQAQLQHDRMAGSTDRLVPAAALLSAAELDTQIKRSARPPDDALLDGAAASYDRDHRQIYYSNATEAALANFHIAHEFAHHWLNLAGAACRVSDLDPATPAEPAPSLVGDPDAYSPKERTEAQANVFAREFLLPRSKLRCRCAAGAVDAKLVATELGIPIELVMQQMADALLLPLEEAAGPSAERERPPDGSQREAMTAPAGPRQVRAGPGSGKTRTLVGRVEHLVSMGEAPSSILALTYSNMSAQDLTERIRRAVGEKATAVWAGTFHAYGLELLRKHRSAIGLAADPKLLDRAGCLLLLEELLPALRLHHYLDLWEPLLKLRAILGAISRAKDELVDADNYARLAQAMRDRAQDDKSRETAERACEVAHVYTVYEQALRSRGLVDFGDLIARSVELLRAHPEIRDAIHAEKPHILVDEYQDMNRASGIFLKELVEPGNGPWVVGDVRQAIYRFRGASPLNMSQFASDFPGAQTTDLDTNYRSGGRIVRMFEAFGGRMAAGHLGPQKSLTADRGEQSGIIEYNIATTREAEAHGIAEAIKAQVAGGHRFRHQAVLARSHTTLARLAVQLEREGVPCLYFGDFFERPEIRDLLSLVSLVSERAGTGLFRVAQMSQYAVCPADIQLVFAWRRQQQVSMLAALKRVDEMAGLSDSGRAGLRRLVDDVADVEWTTSAHTFIMSYLFRRGDYLSGLLGDASVSGQQRRLAVYQLLLFAFSFKATGKSDPKRAFLDHVRRLEILDETKELRQLPAAAGNIDAVRVMTVHASKGLEFPIVHIPALTKSHLPARSQPDLCPPPSGMASDDALMTKEAEEESLFFVGMSRARDNLSLSRALANGGASTKNPSPFLEVIASRLPRPIDGPAGWVSEGPASPEPRPLAGRPESSEWSAGDIETYLDCPRKYYYREVVNIGEDGDPSPFLRFQSALRASIGWMRAAKSADERRDGIVERFQNDWAQWGPAKDHPLEPLFRETAQRMIATALSVMDGASMPSELAATLPETGTSVRCTADHVQSSDGAIVIRRFKGARLAKEESAKARYALQQAAIQRSHPGHRVAFEHVSLQTGDRQDATLTAKQLANALAKIETVIKDVADGKFEPTPNMWCPTCPFFFVCPAHGTTR